MTRVPAVVGSLMFCAACSCFVSPAVADPILVTSGVVQAGFGALGQPWDAQNLQLVGAGLSIGTSLEDEVAFVQLTNLPTVAPGALVDLSGALRVQDPVGALLDNSSAIISAPFTMSFAAVPTRLTCGSALSLSQCTGIAPFTFDADLTFTPSGGVPVMRHLVGSGRAEGRFDRTTGGAIGAVSYIFEPSPVPEPATMMLLGVGLLGAVRATRGRRRQ